MKKLLLKLCLFLPVLMALGLINYCVDPANLFDGNHTRGIVMHMVEGFNVAGLENFDERLFQKLYISKVRDPKDIVVLGSSRAMMISEDFFPGKTFFNSSVSGASLEDQITIFSLYEDQELFPDTIILNLDPWNLDKNHNETRWKTLQTEYNRALAKFTEMDRLDRLKIFFDFSDYEKYKEILSPSYFQASIQNLIHQVEKPKIKYYPTLLKESNVLIKKTDGSISYGEDYRLADIDKIKDRVRNAIRKDIYTLENFHAIDPQLQATFEAFVSYMREKNVEVVFFLVPYQPDYHNFLISSGEYQITHDVQTYYYSYAESQDIKIVGSYDPGDIPCSENEFYDQMHPKPECIQKIFAE